MVWGKVSFLWGDLDANYKAGLMARLHSKCSREVSLLSGVFFHFGRSGTRSIQLAKKLITSMYLHHESSLLRVMGA